MWDDGRVPPKSRRGVKIRTNFIRVGETFFVQLYFELIKLLVGDYMHERSFWAVPGTTA